MLIVYKYSENIIRLYCAADKIENQTKRMRGIKDVKRQQFNHRTLYMANGEKSRYA